MNQDVVVAAITCHFLDVLDLVREVRPWKVGAAHVSITVRPLKRELVVWKLLERLAVVSDLERKMGEMRIARARRATNNSVCHTMRGLVLAPSKITWTIGGHVVVGLELIVKYVSNQVSAHADLSR